MIWTAVEFVAIIVECFMVSRLMIRYFGFRSDVNMVWKWMILFVILSCIDCLGSFVIQNEFFLIIGFILTNAVYSCFLLNGNPFEKVVISTISYILFYLINLPVLTLTSALVNATPEAVISDAAQHVNRVIGIFITKLLYFVATQFILTVRKKERYHFKLNEWIIIISAFIITLTIGFGMYTLVTKSLPEEYIYVSVSLMLSLLDVIIFVFMGKMNRTNQKELEQKQLQAQLAYQQSEIQQIESQYKEVSVLRHDYKNQLNCLRTLMQESNFEEAKAYLGKIIGKQNSVFTSYIHCSNSVLNAVINGKFTEAEKHEIRTSCKILTKIPKEMEYDLSILLSNLLDNAIEACVKENIPTKILLLISDNVGYYRIVVKNTIQESVLKRNEKLKTNKNNQMLHGWGLKSVSEIVEKYDGTRDIYEKNGMFVVSILLTKNEIWNMGAENMTLGAK